MHKTIYVVLALKTGVEILLENVGVKINFGRFWFQTLAYIYNFFNNVVILAIFDDIWRIKLL